MEANVVQCWKLVKKPDLSGFLVFSKRDYSSKIDTSTVTIATIILAEKLVLMVELTMLLMSNSIDSQ